VTARGVEFGFVVPLLAGLPSSPDWLSPQHHKVWLLRMPHSSAKPPASDCQVWGAVVLTALSSTRRGVL
jgi:hypothetical protein